MANNVFANGLEVACKVADGKSVAAFPDPCWSPPAPTAGPQVIPYANTVYADDLANASKTVFITGKPVAQRDKSYFDKSTGNEAATRSFGMGYATHTITGKAYFCSWSMNVFVEGYNVCRHTDLITHNHGSDPSNTPTGIYIDKQARKGVCESDLDRVKKECEIDKKEQKDFQKTIERRNKKREEHNRLVSAKKKKGKKKTAIKPRNETFARLTHNFVAFSNQGKKSSIFQVRLSFVQFLF